MSEQVLPLPTTETTQPTLEVPKKPERSKWRQIYLRSVMVFLGGLLPTMMELQPAQAQSPKPTTPTTTTEPRNKELEGIVDQFWPEPQPEAASAKTEERVSPTEVAQYHDAAQKIIFTARDTVDTFVKVTARAKDVEPHPARLVLGAVFSSIDTNFPGTYDVLTEIVAAQLAAQHADEKTLLEWQKETTLKLAIALRSGTYTKEQLTEPPVLQEITAKPLSEFTNFIIVDVQPDTTLGITFNVPHQ